MKTKTINEIHKYYNEPCKFEGKWKMFSRYPKVFNDIVEQMYDECYTKALEKINKTFLGGKLK